MDRSRPSLKRPAAPTREDVLRKVYGPDVDLAQVFDPEVVDGQIKSAVGRRMGLLDAKAIAATEHEDALQEWICTALEYLLARDAERDGCPGCGMKFICQCKEEDDARG